ncbi:DUF1853 family protein [Pseudohongiella sp.]|uniref:DUF1853 domain-containing protein n=1 Tax=marine sediment metagenome TaxID=412755 RepID=A0A0F9W636_9ZZZZ|nr:DUF1853 family protein [Pseudohongiella sp.]
MTLAPGLLTPRVAASFQTPAVRHLAWLCQTPQLINSPISFRPNDWLPTGSLTTLRHWDRHPEDGPDVLTETPHYRLGLYAERLYECLMRDLLGWTVVARNLPIRDAGITLGELDFIVHNPHTGHNEHHEIAVKFYLGYMARNDLEIRWYGPNARDRLDLKSSRMLREQSQRCRLPETIATLSASGITPPVTSRIFMPGYLFYPRDSALTAPASADSGHLRGYWLRLPDARKRAQSDMSETWVVLRKPHWLGPWSQTGTPEAEALSSVFAEIESSDTPRLFASLAHDKASASWREVQRFFVVPDSWPGC